LAETVIRSRTNPLVKRLRALKERSAGGGLALLEGFTLVEEALSAGIEVVEAAVTPAAEAAARGRALVQRLTASRIAVRRMDASVLAVISEVETSQGLIALARRPSFDEEALYAGRPLIVVAAGLQNPGNVGAVLRAAEAAGATGAYLTAGTADPLSWKALRGAMGSTFRIAVARSLLADAIAAAKLAGAHVIATTASDGVAADEADLSQSVLLLVGNEGAGLGDAVIAQSDVRIRIPMRRGVNSLNVAVTAALLLYEARRQRERDR